MWRRRWAHTLELDKAKNRKQEIDKKKYNKVNLDTQVWKKKKDKLETFQNNFEWIYTSDDDLI